MNYIVAPDDAWVNQQQADSLAALSLQYINGVYNQHGIYFINPAGPCSPPTANLIPTELQGIETIRDVEEGAKHEDGIDIYISEGEDDSAVGFAFGIPNQYLAIQGWDGDTGERAGQTPVAIHELGHCLGLMHPHEGDCDEASACSNSCYCTGDYICDLPSSSNNVACTVPILGTNYMSYTTQNICRNSFTAEQLLRMRAHLSNAHDNIQAAIIPVLEFPGGTLPSGPSNSIVVSAGELHVTSTLEMLPGAYIKVRAGATLRVSAKITGACGQMWRGIIVEGNNTVSQTTANQGRVIVNNNGIIEHAACGIEARRVGENGSVASASGGGIVQAIGGTFLNNSTGIRFGSYPDPNASYILFGNFYTDEGYRAEENTPIHLELINITGLKLNACEFKDYRTDCGNPGKRAIGINSLDASFRAEALCRFENLQTGIFASNLVANTGSFVANNNRFKACNNGIEASSMSDFFIENNDFLVQLAGGCEENEISTEAIGVSLIGKTNSFSLQDNFFHFDDEFPDYALIGTNSQGTGQGMNNEIKKNTYKDMTVANRARGTNRGAFDGLVYLCDSIALTFSSVSEELSDFLVEEGGNIWEDQQDDNAPGDPFPTGNVFSGPNWGSYSIQNLGATINYLFYDGSARQDPESTDSDYIGLNPEATNEENTNCSTQTEPCTPPCHKEALAEVKEGFHATKALWEEQTEAYPEIEDEEEQEIALDSIIRLRRVMNRHARTVLMSYSLDTAGIQTDSILAWLALAETYPADYRLARHYFFAGEFDKYDALWAAIPNRYSLDEAQEAEFDEIETVLNTVRPSLEAGVLLSRLPEATLDSLLYWQNDCTEAGVLARAILWRNGQRLLAHCGGAPPPTRPGNGQQPFATRSEPTEAPLVRWYPNPSQGAINVELPSGYGPANAIFYNLQGKAIWRLSLSEGKAQLQLPSYRFRPGIYLIETRFASGQREYGKLMLTH